MAKQSKVVIVGRTNVGKSTLFNRIIGKRSSMTLDRPGVTRDFVEAEVNIEDREVLLIDTGGLENIGPGDQIYKEVFLRTMKLLEEADLVLFVCDGAVGVTPGDLEMAQILRRVDTKVLVVTNKADVSASSDNQYEFDALGFEGVFPISAVHGRNIDELLEKAAEFIPVESKAEEKEQRCRVAVLGKPNVGKSSLLNAILGKDRFIVADEPGTTREAVTENISFYSSNIELTDTAGVRRGRSISDELEKMMVSSSFSAVRTSDVVLLVVDASAGVMSHQELKLASYAIEQGKALVILFNKSDLLDDNLKSSMEDDLKSHIWLDKKVTVLFTSCKTGSNVGKVLKVVNQLFEKYTKRYSNDELTQILSLATVKKPIHKSGVRLFVRFAEQVSVAPTTIVVTVNYKDYFGDSQCAFLENILRKKFDFSGVPIKLIIKGGRRK